MSTAGYSGTPLARKLGVVAGSRLLISGAPAGFGIGPLPENVTVHSRRTRSPYDVVLGFCHDRVALSRGWARWHPGTTVPGAVWICWPKRSSGLATDLDENVVRDHGLAHGRVDVKVCAVDEQWSGLKFVVRLRDRPHA